MKIITKHSRPPVSPDESVARRLASFCDRCHAGNTELDYLSVDTTLGHKLHYRVCVDEASCKERVLARRRVQERPTAKISDLYPE